MTEGSVYLVTVGSYSDYHVVGVYTDKHLADRLAQSLDVEVEVYPVNPKAHELNQGLTPWQRHRYATSTIW